jgi:hypothetical protein
MDDIQKKFIPKLAIDTEFFHSAFVIECLMANYSQYGGRLDFSKNLPRLSL